MQNKKPEQRKGKFPKDNLEIIARNASETEFVCDCYVENIRFDPDYALGLRNENLKYKISET